MGATLTLLNLAGAIALLMWGVYMVQSGVQRAFGAGLKRFLSRALSSRLKAAGAGLAATALMQSSTATGLIVASLAAAGAMPLAAALAVMLGANVGTTLIVQLFSFNVSHIAPLPILMGVVMFRAGGRRTRDLGRVGIGLGLMLLALSLLLDIITPYEDAPSLRLLMGGIATDPIVACLFGALIAWAAHSSVAVVMLIVSFAAKGIVPPEAALALTIGANLGSALNPLLEAGRSDDPASRRLGAGNFAIRLIGAAAVLPALGWIGPRLVSVVPDAGRAVADFHTAFNLALALVFLPALGPVARLAERLLPRRVEPAHPGEPIYLDASARDTPSVAIGCAAREVLRMADLLDAMIDEAAEALRRRDRETIARVRKQDDALDRLDDAIKRYIADLDPDGLADEEQARLEAILAFALNLEGAGDVVERELMDCAAKLAKSGGALD
ncbi:MAG: Na/Pi cotransporter family protein, partial [Rhodoblastus sp.]